MGWFQRFLGKKQSSSLKKQPASSPGTPALEEKFRPFAANAIAIWPTGDSSHELGHSRIGGSPDLPHNVQWPTADDKALAFIAQIRLAEVSPFDRDCLLPKAGNLYFFYEGTGTVWGFDPKDANAWRVFYADDSEHLAAHKLPSTVPEDARFPEKAVIFKSIETWPNSGLPGMSPEDDELLSELEERTSKSRFHSGARHQLLGQPWTIQGDMQLEAELVSQRLYCGDGKAYKDSRIEKFKIQARDWILLAQFDSDDSLGMQWGDVGMIYYWIRTSDLAKRDFSKVHLCLQCY